MCSSGENWTSEGRKIQVVLAKRAPQCTVSREVRIHQVRQCQVSWPWRVMAVTGAKVKRRQLSGVLVHPVKAVVTVRLRNA